MLELKGRDLFLLSKIIEKMELKKNFPKIRALDKTGMTDEEIDKALSSMQQEQGIQIALTIVESIHKAESEIYKLISNITGKTTLEVQDLSFKELKDIVIEIFSKEEFTSFFK